VPPSAGRSGIQQSQNLGKRLDAYGFEGAVDDHGGYGLDPQTADHFPSGLVGDIENLQVHGPFLRRLFPDDFGLRTAWAPFGDQQLYLHLPFPHARHVRKKQSNLLR